MFAFAGAEYRLAGDLLIKANVGDTKTENGITYKLNQNHRWTTTGVEGQMDLFGGLPTIEDEPTAESISQTIDSMQSQLKEMKESIGGAVEAPKDWDQMVAIAKKNSTTLINSFNESGQQWLDKINQMSSQELEDIGDTDGLVNDEILIGTATKFLEDLGIDTDSEDGDALLLDLSDHIPKLQKTYDKWVDKLDSAISDRSDELDGLDSLIEDAPSDAASDLNVAAAEIKEPESYEEMQSYKAKLKKIRDTLQSKYESKISKAGGSPDAADWAELDEEFETWADEYSDDPDDWE